MKAFKLMPYLVLVCLLCGSCLPRFGPRHRPTEPEAASGKEASSHPADSSETPDASALPEQALSSESAAGTEDAPLSLADFYGGLQYMSETACPSDAQFRSYLRRTLDASPETSSAKILDWAGEVVLRDLGDRQEHGLYLLWTELDGVKTRYGIDCRSGELYHWISRAAANGLDGIPDRVTPPERIPDELTALRLVHDSFWDPSMYSVPFTLTLYEDGEFGPYYQSERMDLGGDGSVTYCINVTETVEGSFSVHAYEGVLHGEEGHTATTNWYTVRRNGFVSDHFENVWIYDGEPLASPS